MIIKAGKNNVVNEQEIIQNNINVDIAGQPLKISLIAYKLSICYIHSLQHEVPYIDNLKET